MPNEDTKDVSASTLAAAACSAEISLRLGTPKDEKSKGPSGSKDAADGDVEGKKWEKEGNTATLPGDGPDMGRAGYALARMTIGR
jgi:hypothetical protein